MDIHILNDDCLLYIFSFLSPKDLINCAEGKNLINTSSMLFCELFTLCVNSFNHQNYLKLILHCKKPSVSRRANQLNHGACWINSTPQFVT